MSKLYNEYCKTYKLTDDNSDRFFEFVKDIYFSDEVQSLAQYEQHLDINRLQHITSVAYLSYKICKHFGWNFKSAAKCAMMHDLFYYDWRDGTSGKWHRLHGYKHPHYAAMNAKELCPDLSKKEAEIISHHMWPLTIAPPTSVEGLVICLADKYCAANELRYSLSKNYKERFLKKVEKI
ncbi:MAG: HD domain-containing protein [Acutalibacteraceae bacterium]